MLRQLAAKTLDGAPPFSLLLDHVEDLFAPS